MKRRDIVKVLGLGVAAAGLAACTEEKKEVADCQPAAPAAAEKPETIEWKMVTTWPKNFPGLGTGANQLADLIGQMSGGRINVKVYGATELVGALEIFDAVSRGTAEMGHGASYYWKGDRKSVV